MPNRYLEGKRTVLWLAFLMGEQFLKTLKLDYLSLVRVEAHIRKNLITPLKISDLSEVAGFNTTKLKRDFKKLYGTSIFKYITALRMELAKNLITQDAVSIAQAAFEVGYANPQHFTTAFKRNMGYLPSELKSKVQ